MSAWLPLASGSGRRLDRERAPRPAAGRAYGRRRRPAAFEALVAEGRLGEAVEICQGEVLADLDDEWVLEARSRALRLLHEGDQRRRVILVRPAVAYQRLEHFLFVRVHGMSVSGAHSSARDRAALADRLRSDLS